MARAVGQEDFSRPDLEEADLTDVVGVAILMVSYGTDIAGLEATLQELPREAAGHERVENNAVMQDSAAEVTP